jgi:hypothetical protein
MNKFPDPGAAEVRRIRTGGPLTGADVKRRLREAGQTFAAWSACQPKPGPVGYKSTWPEVVRQAAESYGQYMAADLARLARQTPPPPRAIDEMEEAMEWLTLVGLDDRRMLWAYARGIALWRIGQMFRRSERTMRTWIDRAAAKIAERIRK